MIVQANLFPKLTDDGNKRCGNINRSDSIM